MAGKISSKNPFYEAPHAFRGNSGGNSECNLKITRIPLKGGSEFSTIFWWWYWPQQFLANISGLVSIRFSLLQ